MPEIRLKIKGVHYAVHPDYNPRRGDVFTDEMEQRTIERLRKLNEKRPKVILVPEPDNPIAPNAVRAWCEGTPSVVWMLVRLRKLIISLVTLAKWPLYKLNP